MEDIVRFWLGLILFMSSIGFGVDVAARESRQQQLDYALRDSGGVLVIDPQLNSYISRLGQALAKSMDDEGRAYRFSLVNQDSPDAWSLPGGSIAISRGMLALLDNEAELVALLAHEIAHAAAVYEDATHDQTIARGEARLSEPSNYALGAARAPVVHLLKTRHARIPELQADRRAQDVIAETEYDPAAAVRLLEKLSELGDETHYARRHPPSEERLQRLRENVHRLGSRMSSDSWSLREESFAKNLVKLRQAEEAFLFAQTSRKRRLWNAVLMIDRAIELFPAALPKEHSFLSLKAGYMIELANCRGALKLYESEFKAAARTYLDWLKLGHCFQQLGDSVAAVSAYKKSNELLPNATATKSIADLSFLMDNRETAKRHYLKLMSDNGSYQDEAQRMFTTLDIQDNPLFYFLARSTVAEGELTSFVQNLTDIPVRSIDVEFTATIAGKDHYKVMSTGPLTGHSQVQLFPGWKIDNEEDISHIRVVATKVNME